MNDDLAMLSECAPAFTLILARVGAAMALLPGVGEAVAPAIVRIGLALSVTILLVPALQTIIPPVPATGLDFGLMIASEVITGIWFSWVARMLVLALPISAQFIGYFIGLSSVLQPDAELGGQSGTLGKLFEIAAPAIILVTGLYRMPLTALDGLYQLIPPGHLLPPTESAEVALRAVGTGFSLALQLASPFAVMAIAWHVAMGLVSRIVSRMQIYFVSMPGQIVLGLTLLVATASAMTLVWSNGVQAFFGVLRPGG